VKYLLLAALLVTVVMPRSASLAQEVVGKEKGMVNMIVGKDGGVVSIPSNHSVDETVDRLKNILGSKEITLFALIDHSGEAAKVGMKTPTKLLIFGNPKGGTPLPRPSARAAIEPAAPLSIALTMPPSDLDYLGIGRRSMRTKRWARLASVMMLIGPLLLVARATAGDGETCVNASDGVAIAACTRAIRSGRYNGHGLAVLYANRCAAHFNKGETDLALSDCNQAIQLDPKNAMAFHNRAAGYSAKGDYDRAIGDLDQVIQLDPKNAEAFNNRGFGYAAKGDYDRAVGDYDQAIQLDPKNAISYTSRCAAHIKKGETDQALSDCNQAIQLDPKNAMAYANRCAAHFNKGETDLALSDCNQAIQLDPKSAWLPTTARPGTLPKVTMTAPSVTWIR
jgi:Flp pilus assembly protein TadD/uncharacterized protein (DUF302 family)